MSPCRSSHNGSKLHTPEGERRVGDVRVGEDIGPEGDGNPGGLAHFGPVHPVGIINVLDIPVDRTSRDRIIGQLAPLFERRVGNQRGRMGPFEIRHDFLALFGKDILLLGTTPEQHRKCQAQDDEQSFHRHIIVQIYKNNPIYELKTEKIRSLYPRMAKKRG